MGFFADHAGDAEVPKSRLYTIGLKVHGTVAAAVTTGSHAVTPSSMGSIAIGTVLSISNANGTSAEDVTVTAADATTFTATFANAHTVNWIFRVPIPVYWTDYDIDIVWDSHTWVAQPITPGPVSEQPDGASATFRIADGSNVIFPVLAADNGGELASAAIYEAGFLTTNKTAVPDEVLQIFSGRVDRSTINTDDSIEFVLMPPDQQNIAKLPTRLVSTLVRVT